MTEIERLRALAAGAREAYPEIKARCEARATRWEWATFALYSPEPAYFEVHKFTPGDRLPGRPARSGHGYGFDPTDQIVLEHQLTELPGRFYETFYERAADGFARYHFHYSREKELINVGWFSLDDRGRVSAIDTLYSAGSWRTQIFRYEERLQTIEHRTEEGVDYRDLEWDAQGRIARVYWRYPDGRRILDYERPSEDRTFAVNRRELRLRLGDAIRSSLAIIGEPVQAVALHWCGAEYQHRLPPHVAACTASELEQLRESFGDELDSVWNPAEWKRHLHVPLGELESLYDSVNQDIWQNDLDDEVDLLLSEIAIDLMRDPRVPVADGFVAYATDLDRYSGSEDAARHAAKGRMS